MASPGPRVAIVGGGISGLICGIRLNQIGIQNVTVFDTGKHSCGGRASSRLVTINGKVHIFDHCSQYFTVDDKQFAKVVSTLVDKGAAKVWDGPTGHIQSNGSFVPNPAHYQAFVGTEGMQSISKCLAGMVNVVQPVWISNVSWEAAAKKWKVDKYGYFDYLVIAHNGKCADKLMSTSGAAKIHQLTRVRFGDRLLPKDPRMQLCSLWVLMVAFPESLKLKYEGAHAQDAVISWISNNTVKIHGRKLKTKGPPSIPSLARDNTECWTMISTREFGTANKVPQENIPPRKSEEITKMMLDAFSRITRIKRDSLKPCFTKVQLWGAALPMNILAGVAPEKCVFDSDNNVGICGDWLVSPSIQGAAVSGLALADKISLHSKGTKNVGTSLQPTFKPADGGVIGHFPTDPNMIYRPSKK